MKHLKVIVCPKCGCDDLQKNGHSPNGTQRWLCRGCRKFFQLHFNQNGRNQEVKDKVIEMVMNGSGIRDTARVLRISTTTVIKTIKKNSDRN